MTNYQPITPQQFPKFAGIKTYMRLPYAKTTKGIDFAVIGIPWDGGTSYRTGQRLGPDAIRKVSVTLRPYNLALDVGIFEHCSGVDYGDLLVVPGENHLTRARCLPNIRCWARDLLPGGVRGSLLAARSEWL